MELVHTDHSFEPEEGFFQLFSDPRSTRLTRVQLREDVVRDKDLEAIRKQVGSLVIACFQENRAAGVEQPSSSSRSSFCLFQLWGCWHPCHPQAWVVTVAPPTLSRGSLRTVVRLLRKLRCANI